MTRPARPRVRAAIRNSRTAAVARRVGVVTSPSESRSERESREALERLLAGEVA